MKAPVGLELSPWFASLLLLGSVSHPVPGQVGCPFPRSPCTAVPNGPAHFWSGGNARDLVTGTLGRFRGNAAAGIGQHGSAFLLTASRPCSSETRGLDCLDTGVTTELPHKTGYTISTWFQLIPVGLGAGQSAAWVVAAKNGTGGGKGCGHGNFYLSLHTSSASGQLPTAADVNLCINVDATRPSWPFPCDASANKSFYTVNKVITFGDLHHLAIVNPNDGSNEPTIYLNGLSQNLQNETAGFEVNSESSRSEPVLIGCNNPGSEFCGLPFSGPIYNFATWTRELDEAEVQNLYGAGVSGLCLPDVAAWWPASCSSSTPALQQYQGSYPWLGQAFRLELPGFSGSLAAGILSLATQEVFLPGIEGCPLLVTLSGLPPVLTQSSVVDFPLPAVPALAGSNVFAQALVIDAATARLTNGVCGVLGWSM